VDHALGMGEVEAPHDADALGDRVVHAGELGIARGLDQRAVEFLVEARDARAVGEPAARRHQPHFLQARERRLRIARAQALHRRGLEHEAQVVEVVEQLEVERPHAPAALCMDLDVALARETKKGLAHRRSRNAGASRDLVLREAAAGQQAELEDVALQRAVDRFREVLRRGKNRGPSPTFPRLVHAGSGVDCQATICQPCFPFTQTLVKRLFSFFGWPPERSWILTWPVTTAQSPCTWMSSIGRSTSWYCHFFERMPSR